MISIPSPAPLTLPRRTPQTIARADLRGLTPARFTVDGSDTLERHLAVWCTKMAAAIRGLLPKRLLEAVVLGGGYGRGEGGVLRTAAGDRPYNDLEFYVFVRGNRHINELRFGRALHVLGQILTPQVGVEVEFKIASLNEMARQRPSMFLYDLVCGHRVVFGRENVLGHLVAHRDGAGVPIAEATRLLMNRCSGLLFARERLDRPEFTAADADFVRRNIAKAELALGDAVLVVRGQYHWSARERAARLAQLAAHAGVPWSDALTRCHEAGVKFKLHPERSSATRDELAVRHAEVTSLAKQIFLWVEERRLGHAYRAARDYAEDPANKAPETSPRRNRMVNAKVLGPRAAFSRHAGVHPRQSVLHALALLLWEPAALKCYRFVSQLHRELRTQARTLPEFVAAYQRLWQHVN